MARLQKLEWRICHLCLEKFEAESMRKLDELVAAHKVSTDAGPKCACSKQLEMMFKRVGKSWRMK